MLLNSTTYARSPHWSNGRFTNQVPTKLEIHARDLPGLLKAILFPDPDRTPKGDLPVVRIDPAALLAPPSAPRLTWFGHSALLLEMSGMIILLDPMMGTVPATADRDRGTAGRGCCGDLARSLRPSSPQHRLVIFREGACGIGIGRSGVPS